MHNKFGGAGSDLRGGAARCDLFKKEYCELIKPKLLLVQFMQPSPLA